MGVYQVDDDDYQVDAENFLIFPGRPRPKRVAAPEKVLQYTTLGIGYTQISRDMLKLSKEKKLCEEKSRGSSVSAVEGLRRRRPKGSRSPGGQQRIRRSSSFPRPKSSRSPESPLWSPQRRSPLATSRSPPAPPWRRSLDPVARPKSSRSPQWSPQRRSPLARSRSPPWRSSFSSLAPLARQKSSRSPSPQWSPQQPQRRSPLARSRSPQWRSSLAWPPGPPPWQDRKGRGRRRSQRRRQGSSLAAGRRDQKDRDHNDHNDHNHNRDGDTESDTEI